MGSNGQLYSLSWGEFSSSLASAVQLLRGDGDLVDVTLAAGGRSFPAHKIVLCAASPFLLDLLKSTPCQHPVVMLAGIGADDLESLLEFVYRGEVSVEPAQLPSLLQAAHCLSIHGLTSSTNILTESGEKVPESAIPTATNNDELSRPTVNSHPLKRRKKRRKSSSSSGKWQCTRSTADSESKSLEDNNKTMPYENKDDDAMDQTDDTAGNCLAGNYANNHQGGSHSPRLQESSIADNHQAMHQDHGADDESHLHTLMPLQLQIPQFHSSLNMGYPPGLALSGLASTQTASTGTNQSKTRGASDCPGVCPLCGATLRQARNLRRHLLSSCKYRFNHSATNAVTMTTHNSDAATVEIKPEIEGYNDQSSITYGTDGSNDYEQIVCNPTLPSPTSHEPESVISSPRSIPLSSFEFVLGDGLSKARSLSDQPVSCPLCGAILRQSRNLRRHLELLHFGLGNNSKSGIHARRRRAAVAAAAAAADRVSDFGLSSLTCVRPPARLDSHLATRSSEASNFSMVTPLSITSSVSSASSVSLSGNLMGTSSSLLGSGDQNGHTLPGATPATCSTSMVPPTNGIYSSDGGPSMLSCLLPSLPTLPSFSTSHDVFRHGEMLRAGIAYHDSSRQHVRHMQRTDVT
ncbi:PREDICTED: transcription factor GAGA-like [Cyphomyrmex costatus]|uniref:transcription factor GAGA-like n=1 Tax=Cyphomyrmex costatus TaxID=456900 RepID=UPI0008522DF0|nr:PREDICTED: transcription factor GAGA-like [Cyphomyrmex costatus]